MCTEKIDECGNIVVIFTNNIIVIFLLKLMWLLVFFLFDIFTHSVDLGKL